jgi:hypothetical protein
MYFKCASQYIVRVYLGTSWSLDMMLHVSIKLGATGSVVSGAPRFSIFTATFGAQRRSSAPSDTREMEFIDMQRGSSLVEKETRWVRVGDGGLWDALRLGNGGKNMISLSLLVLLSEA